MRERRVTRPGVVATAAMLVVAACTGGDGENGGAGPTQPPTATDTHPSANPATDTEPTGSPTESPRDVARATRAPDTGPPPVGAVAVSAGHPIAVEAGMTVLDEGGTAVDAAVAAAFVMGVVEPFASGLGGGGAVLVQEQGERPQAYEYTEVVAQDGHLPASDSGIPGFVAGMERVHTDHGELGWGRLVNPAIELAEDGVPTTGILADQLRSGAGRLPVGDLEQFFPGGMPLSTGDTLLQPELADSLRAVAEEGVPAFYEDALGGRLTEVDGIDAESLAAYEVATSRPPTGRVGPYRVIGAPLPLTGVTLIQLLQVATARGAAEAEPGSAPFVDAVTTGWRHADEALRTEVADPAFVEVPVARLTDADRNAQLVGGEPLPEPAGSGGAGNTTHISVVDADGTAVSMTNTILNFWGSGQEVGGFFLNDRLRRFEISEASGTPEPGQRAPSYMSPTIVTDAQGRPVLVIGTPGGSRIPNLLAAVILRWGFAGQSLQAAVDGPRFHYEDGVLYTEQLPDRAAGQLAEQGYTVSEQPPWDYYFGSVQALEVDHDEGVIRGAEDDRRAGTFAVTDAGG